MSTSHIMRGVLPFQNVGSVMYAQGVETMTDPVRQLARPATQVCALCGVECKEENREELCVACLAALDEVDPRGGPDWDAYWEDRQS